MGYKLKRILIYPDGVTEKQVYPAKQKIIYDFKSQNVLTFKYQGDSTFPYGYTAGSGYYTVKNSYYQGITLWTLPNEAYVNDVKKVTLKGSAQSAICSFVMVNGNGFNGSMTGIRGWVSSGGPSQGAIQQMVSGTSTWPLGDMTFPTGDLEFQVDLENGVLNYGTYVATLTSDFISAFKTSRANGSMRIGIVNGNYNAGSNNYYTYLKECIIEY